MVWDEGRLRKMTGEGPLGGELAYGGRWGGREGRGRDVSTATGGRGVRRASHEAGLGTGHVKQTRKTTPAHIPTMSLATVSEMSFYRCPWGTSHGEK